MLSPIMRAEMSAKGRTNDRAGLPLRDFPLDLKLSLAKQAEAEGTNFNDFCVAILARKLKVRYESNGRPSSGITDSTYVTLEMPAMLRAKIKATAAMRRVSSQAFVIDELATALTNERK